MIASAGVSADPFEPAPSHIGPYEVVGRIATGGMAEVFAARTRDALGHPIVVAVKRPRRDGLEERRLVEMFLDEARLAALVHSRHCVATHALGTDDEGLPYLVMPLVVGVSLHRLLARGGALPPAVAAEIAAQTADGLDDAHRAVAQDGTPLGIVHRDVSPHNVMVDTDGLVRVADFGIARAYWRISRTRTGQLKGKLGYLSPEQIMGQPLDGRADVFALGIVLWEMFTGRRFVRAKSFFDAHRALVVDPVPDVREYAPAVPSALAACVARAMAREPSERFDDAAAMSVALRAAVGRGVSSAEVAALVMSRSDAELGRLVDLAQAARGVGTWRSGVTALPRADDPSDGETQLSTGSLDATMVSAPPSFDEVTRWPARTWAWLVAWWSRQRRRFR